MSNSRKRQRLETTTAIAAPAITVGGIEFADDDMLQHSATTLPISDSMSGQSIFLTQTSGNISNNHAALGNVLPNNVFLTICDGEEDEVEEESQEFLIDSELAAHIKQEHDASTQTQKPLPLQYRIVNQLEADHSSSPNDELNAQTTTLLPAAVQLPSGCEIYLVKEYVDASAGNSELLSAGIPTSRLGNNNSRDNATIKLEKDANATSVVNTGIVGNTALQLRNAAGSRGGTTAVPLVTAAGSVVAQRKRSFILETYKKRDDKRRATHNEVERRRRDKINSWIFKLKEMLPTEAAQSNNNNSIIITNTTSTVGADTLNGVAAFEEQQQQRHVNSNNNQNSTNNNRTPPSDSKSQILIKACEYIKAMQDEVKSLRECLTENGNLRLCNQRLQNELNKLKHECNGCAFSNNSTLNISSSSVSSNHNNNNNKINNNNSSNSNNRNSTFNLTLNTLNRNGLFGAPAGQTATRITANTLGRLGIDTVAVGGGMMNNLTPTTYTKRELIIRDYVD